MSYQIPAPNSIVADTRPLGGTPPTTAVTPVQPPVQVGQVLDVVVAKDHQGHDGVVLNGQFYRAQLDVQAEVGTTLKVIVQSKSEVLTLRVLNPALLNAATIPTSASQPTAFVFEQILRALLSPEQLRQLVNSAAARSLLGSMGRDSESAATAESNAEIREILAKIAPQVLKDGSVLTDQDLESAHEVSEFLQRLTRKDLSGQARSASTKLARDTDVRTEPIRKFAAALLQFIDTLLNSENSLAASEPSATETRMIPQQLALALAASQYATHATGATTLPLLTQTLNKVEQRAHPLIILLSALSGYSSSEATTVPSNTQILQTIFQALAAELPRLINSNVGDKEIRAVLSKTAADLRTALQALVRSSESPSERAQALQILRNLEHLLEGQAILNRVNPLMHSLGQPAVVNIPVLFPNQLARWELTTMPPKVGEERNQSKAEASFQHLSINLALAALGAVDVSIAHRPGELLIQFAVEKREVAEFLSQRFNALHEVVALLGFTRAEFFARERSTSTAHAAWYEAVCRASTIA